MASLPLGVPAGGSGTEKFPKMKRMNKSPAIAEHKIAQQPISGRTVQARNRSRGGPLAPPSILVNRNEQPRQNSKQEWNTEASKPNQSNSRGNGAEEQAQGRRRARTA
jgi:hypothetical protein